MYIRIKNLYSNMFKTIKGTKSHPKEDRHSKRTFAQLHRTPSTHRHYAPRARTHPASREGFTENTRSFDLYDSFARIPGNVTGRVSYIYTFGFDSIVFLKSHSGRGDIGKSRGDVLGVYTRTV
jgi:hypothetical protein